MAVGSMNNPMSKPLAYDSAVALQAVPGSQEVHRLRSDPALRVGLAQMASISNRDAVTGQQNFQQLGDGFGALDFISWRREDLVRQRHL